MERYNNQRDANKYINGGITMNDKKLTKSLDKRMICGVCGGISEYFGIDVTLVRLLWVLISVFTAAAGLVAYIIAAIIMPEA